MAGLVPAIHVGNFGSKTQITGTRRFAPAR
jgi:hypothetical protein